MTAETVSEMIGQILEHEGPEFTDRPADHGGPTKFGVTLTLLQSLNPRATVADIRDMTADDASQIYQRVFYRQPHIDTLPADFQPMMFDEAVNMGQGHAIKCLQSAILCPADGQIGDGTRTVLNDAVARNGVRYVNNRIVDAFIARYAEIVQADPTQEQFIDGWKNRANSWRIQ